MFIGKRRYLQIMFRLDEMGKAIEEHDGGFSALSESVSELTGRVGALEEEAETVAEERKREKDFYDGFTNILNYEVSYGQSKKN